MQLQQLRRVRWAVRATLVFGVAASVAANVLHALPNPISQTISAWPPLALLLTVELISRVPMHKWTLAFLRLAATAAIASIAAWVSYWHMASVASNYGESQTSAYLLPVSVDGLIVVASVCLVELAGRIRVLEDQRRVTTGESATQQPVGAPAVAPVMFSEPPAVPVRPAMLPPLVTTATPEIPIPVSPGVGPISVGTRPAGPGPLVNGSRVSTPAVSAPPRKATTATIAPRMSTERTSATVTDRFSTPDAAERIERLATTTPVKAMPARVTTNPTNLPGQRRRPASETAKLVAEMQARHPGISPTELAEKLGISPSRLRAVRRESATSDAA